MTGESVRRTRKPLGVAAAGALLAVLVPKCPMCLAMYLSFLGAAASWFVWLRPLGVVLTVAGVAVAAWRWIRHEANMKITGKRILITGANRGIGEALVNEALRRGARQIHAGTRGALRHPEGRVTPIALDVTNEAQIRRAADELEGLDLLINNAGIALYDDLGKLDTIERQLAVNCFGSLRVAHALLPLLERSRGAIANILSLAALAPVPVIPGYSISKAAALSMTQSLRLSLAGRGVAVHAVFLGPVDTDMNRGFEYPEGLAGIGGDRNPRRAGARGRGHLPRSGFPAGGRWLPHRDRQDAGARVLRAARALTAERAQTGRDPEPFWNDRGMRSGE